MSNQVDFSGFEAEAIKESQQRIKDEPVDIKRMAGRMVKGIMDNKYISRSLILFAIYIVSIGIATLFTSLVLIVVYIGLVMVICLMTKYESVIKRFIQWLRKK